MATKSAKPTKKATYSGDRLIMPELMPRDPDTKYLGNEPLFATQPDPDRRNGALAVAFNWYTRFYDRKMAKEQLANYMDYLDKKDIGQVLRGVEDKEVITTLGWLARLNMRGLELTDYEKSTLDNEIQRLVQTTFKPELVAAPETKVSNRPNVQEIMRERTMEAGGEMEHWLDVFTLAGAKTADTAPSPVSILTEKNILPQHVSILTEVWQNKRNEFVEVLEGKDKLLVEAYSQFTKTQLKALVKFCESVIAGLASYINVKKANKAPRKRRAVSPEKQASKVKYLKVFEELSLVSIHPAKLIGATEALLYDTVKRKLWYLVADSHVGTLGVKGTSILGFDSTASGVKTIRKPAEQIKKIMAAGRPATRKLFKEIATVQAQPNGRTNDSIIILKAY